MRVQRPAPRFTRNPQVVTLVPKFGPALSILKQMLTLLTGLHGWQHQSLHTVYFSV